MSAEMTSQEDLDDVAFRALLAPLAREVLPVPPLSPSIRTADPDHLSTERAPDGQLPKPAKALANSAQSVSHEHGPSSPACEPTQPAPPVSGPPLTVLLVPGMLDEPGSSPQPTLPPDPVTPVTEMLPGDWSLPGELPDDWSTPEEFASSLPFDLSSEELEDRPLPATGQFGSLDSGMLPTGRWRFTAGVPGQFRESRAPTDGALASVNVSPADELRPVRSPTTSTALGVARPTISPRLVARAGAARDAVALPVSQTQLVMRKPVLPPAQVNWNVVLLACVASAFLVACVSWLFDPPSPVEPVEAAVAAPALAAFTSPVASAASGSLEPRPASPTVASQAATQSGSTPAAPPMATPKQPTTPPQAMIGLLMRRGDAVLAVGDIIAARHLYERAAAMGSAIAATAAGKTYDLDFLLRADTHGILPDSAAAAAWYRKAAALGDPEARTLLGRFEAPARP